MSDIDTLKEEAANKVLAAARALQDEGDRAGALSRVAPYLPESLKRELLNAVSAIQDEGHRAGALSRVAPYLPESLKRDLLAAACAIQDEGHGHRAGVLSRVAPYLPESLKRDLLAAACAIQREGYRAEALSAVAPYLPEDLKRDLLTEVCAIRNEWCLGPALSAVAPYLPEDLKPDLLTEVCAIRNEGHRAAALSAVAPYLPEDLKPDLLTEVCAIRNEGDRAAALSAVAPYLPESFKREVLTAVCAIQSEGYRAAAMSAVAPHLPEGLKPELLAAASAIQDEGYRARALAPPPLPWHLLHFQRGHASDGELHSLHFQRGHASDGEAIERRATVLGFPKDTEAFVHIDILERQDPILEIPPRSLELWEGVIADRSYEVRIDLSEERDPHQEKGSDHPALHKAAEDIISLRVAVVTNSPSLYFINQVSMIAWGPGPKIEPAIFQLHILSAQPGSFDVFIDRDCDLLFAARVKLEVAEESGNWTSKMPIAWDDATAEKVSGTKRSVAFQRFSALTQKQPGERAVCIAITRGIGSDEYIFTMLRGHTELPMRVKSSRAELDLLLMQVRGRLDRQRREPVLVDGGYDATGTYVGNYETGATCRRANGTAVPTLLIEESWNSFLSDMAIHGRALRDRLFSDAASQEVLKAIRKATPEGGVVQVWTRDEAKEFLLPWAWIYDGDYRPGSRERPQPEEFWGQRLIIEQLVEIVDPMPRMALGSKVATDKGVKIQAGVYNFVQLPAHRKFLEGLERPPAGGAGTVKVEIADNATIFAQSLESCDADLIYFFCHGHSARPLSVAPGSYYDMFENLRQWLTSSDAAEPPGSLWASLRRWVRNALMKNSDSASLGLKDTKARLRNALDELLASGLMAHDHVRLKDGCLILADLRKLRSSGPHVPLVVLNMCESAQVFPSLSDGLVNVFLSRGARGVIGTEMPMLPQFADLFGRKFLTTILEGSPVGYTMLALRREFMALRNPLGLAYTHFGDALVRFEPPVLSAVE